MDNRYGPRSEKTRRRMQRARHHGLFSVVRSTGSRGQVHYRLNVPTTIARTIPEDQEFTVELTEEGILYRAVPIGHDPPELEAPSWARKDI